MTRTAVTTLLLALGLSALGCASPVPIPDLDVAGPPASFDMGSRLMTSASRTKVRVSSPAKGSADLPKVNGTFFYRHDRPEATTGTLLFRTDQVEAVEGSLAPELQDALDFKQHPFFAFQSHSASLSEDGIDLEGKLIVGSRETNTALRLIDPGRVAVGDDTKKWIRIAAQMQVDPSTLGLGSLGSHLELTFDLFLVGYTADSAKATGIDTEALGASPPMLPAGAEALSNAGWHLILTGRYNEAITAFDASIELDPSNVGTYLRRGDAYLFAGHYGKAMGTYTTMTQYNPVMSHIFELTKILDRQYLTPETLQAANAKWLESR